MDNEKAAVKSGFLYFMNSLLCYVLLKQYL